MSRKNPVPLTITHPCLYDSFWEECIIFIPMDVSEVLSKWYEGSTYVYLHCQDGNWTLKALT